MRDPKTHAKVLSLRLKALDVATENPSDYGVRWKRLWALAGLVDDAVSTHERRTGWYYDWYLRAWTRRTYTTIPDTEEEA